MIPFVIEQTAKGERSYDLFSRLLRDRIIFINGEISTEMSHVIVAQLLFLESEDSSKDITMIINSPGGEVTAGLAIHDSMQFIKPDVQTIVSGQCCSMGSFLAHAGAPGKRYMLPTSRHMIHSVSGGQRGTVWDTEIQMAEMVRLNKLLTEFYVTYNSKGKTFDEFKLAMSRDCFMSPQESIDFGLADRIIANRSDVV
jgi:ATP-dependent Clp protease protease subunit